MIKKVTFDENGLAEFYFENDYCITSLISDGLYAREVLERSLFPQEVVSLQISGLGEKDKEVPLKRGDIIKIIVKLIKKTP